MSYVLLEAFLPNHENPIEAHPAEAVLAMCLWGEARGGTLEAKAAVASVILNRVKAKAGRFWPIEAQSLNEKVRGVILRPWQFSCFNADDPNRAKLLKPEQHDTLAVWHECAGVAAMALDGLLTDPTRGADHYFSPVYDTTPEGKIVIRNKPKWADGKTPTLTLRGFMFYKIG